MGLSFKEEQMTISPRFPTPLALAAMLTIVLLAAPASSSAAVPVAHFQANGTFSDVFSCDASGFCGALSVFLGGISRAPQTFVSYVLLQPTGEMFIGFGTIPNANVTKNDSKTLTLAPTDTSTIEGFTNQFCDVNGICTDVAGGIVSGSWKQIRFFSTHSTFSNVEKFGPIQFISAGTSDDFIATAQFSVLGNSFNDFGDIGTEHNTQVTIQHQ
jgi:hypothetical protein